MGDQREELRSLASFLEGFVETGVPVWHCVRASAGLKAEVEGARASG